MSSDACSCLWTVPGRKTCMWSSSFPNTTTIPNFKPISLTVVLEAIPPNR